MEESASEHPTEHIDDMLCDQQPEGAECFSSEESMSSEMESATVSSVTSPSVSSLSSQAEISSDNYSDEEHLPDNIHMKTYPTFKLVGDNLDKSIHPRDMRLDHQTKALHYFHMYAVRDCVNLADYTDNPSLPDISPSDLKTILPTIQDEEVLHANFAILIARTLTSFMPFFKKFGSGLERHLVHERYEEMSSKSEVVSMQIAIESECMQEHKYLTNPRMCNTKVL